MLQIFGTGAVETPSSFTPAALSNCEFYVEADVGIAVSNGQDITQGSGGGHVWADQSGNGRDITSAGFSFYETGAINGLPCVHNTSGGYGSFASNFMSGFTEAEMYCLYKIDGVQGHLHNMGLSGSGGTQSDCYQPYSGDGTFYEDFGSTTRRNGLTPNVDPASQFRLYNVVARAGSYDIRQDGVSMFSSGSNTVGFPSTIYIMRSNPNVGILKLLAFVIYTGAAKTLTERNQLRDFWNAKYGLSIS